MNDEPGPDVLRDGHVINLALSEQRDHDKPGDSGNANDFLNQPSRKIEYGEKSLAIPAS
jgi:hypothetical protein